MGLLGSREVNIYGNTDFETFFAKLKDKFNDCELVYFQSDSVEEISLMIHECAHFDGIVLNPGAFTHTSIILADAIKSVPVKVVEVHISNLFGREQFRKNSMIAAVCAGSISGFGLKGYELAVSSFYD